MDHAERRVTVPNLVGSNDANGYQIINLIECDLLASQFFPDGIQTFYPAFNEDKRHLRVIHLLFNLGRDRVNERFVLGTPFFELLGELAVIFGMKMKKREIFHLTAQFAHAQAEIGSTSCMVQKEYVRIP